MTDFFTQDHDLFLYLNNLGQSEFDAFWIFVSGKWSWIPLYAWFLYLLYKNYSLKKLGLILVFLALGILVSDQLSNVFKYGFERLRPCHDEALIHSMRIVECGGRYGFFSSHASNSFVLASFLSSLLGRYYKLLPCFFYAWAMLVAYSRIYLGVHFPTDILVGMFFGILIGNVMAKSVKYFFHRMS